MSKSEVKYCDVTHKLCMSEAKALRLTQSREDIERYYFCEHCNEFHLTSWPWHHDLENEGEERENILGFDLENKIESRIFELKKKLDNKK